MLGCIRLLILYSLDLLALPFLVCAALVSRCFRRPVDIGLGPEPLINNVYHQRALRKAGFSAETFVSEVYFITDEFDVRADRLFRGPLYVLIPYYLFIRAVFRYRCLYLYFSGGPLLGAPFSQWWEPRLLRLANVKVVVMPYGSDVQDMSRTGNAVFKHYLSLDYNRNHLRRKQVSRRIDMWTRSASHVIGGCDWVDYLYHWDTLMLAHFSIDTDQWCPQDSDASFDDRPLRILHAPNHRSIKGTQFFIEAVDELRDEGVPVELVLLERTPNAKVREAMANVDIVADQLIVGWYAMFALEAMALGKPVLCFLRPDLLELYTTTGLLTPGEIPVVNCNPLTVKERIRELVDNPARISQIGCRSRQYVLKHHSLEAVGRVFARINAQIKLA